MIRKDIKEMIISWMNDNDTTQWSEGLRFVQFQKTRSHHRAIDQPPYIALFGADPNNGLSSSSIPKELLPQLETEEDLEQILADAGEGDTTDNKGEGVTDDHGEGITDDHVTRVSEMTPLSNTNTNTKYNVADAPVADKSDDDTPQAFTETMLEAKDVATHLSTKLSESIEGLVMLEPSRTTSETFTAPSGLLVRVYLE